MRKRGTAALVAKGACLHTDVTIIEVADPELLREIRADRFAGPLIVAQLSDRVAIAAAGSGVDLIKHLKRAGHTPKVSRGTSGIG